MASIREGTRPVIPPEAAGCRPAGVRLSDPHSRPRLGSSLAMLAGQCLHSHDLRGQQASQPAEGARSALRSVPSMGAIPVAIPTEASQTGIQAPPDRPDQQQHGGEFPVGESIPAVEDQITQT